MENCTFLECFKTFTVQAMAGPMMVLVKRQKENSEIDNGMVIYVYAKYLNICWHSYGKKDDPVVVKMFDKLLSFNKIKGIVCLMNWFKLIGMEIIKNFDLNKLLKEMKHLSVNKKHNVLSKQLEFITSQFDSILDKICCKGQDCDNEYDGTDLFVFEKK